MTKEKTNKISEKSSEKPKQEDQMMQLQMMQDHIQQLKQYLEQYDQQLGEIASLISTLGDLEEVNGNEDVLMPIANGIFAEGKLSSTKTLKVNVGQGVLVEKTIPEAKELLQTQFKELETLRGQAMIQFHEFISEMQKIEEQIRG